MKAEVLAETLGLLNKFTNIFKFLNQFNVFLFSIMNQPPVTGPFAAQILLDV